MITMDSRIVGVWYMQTTPTSDWMAGVSEVVPDKEYELNYRFRYYDGDQKKDTFEDGDTKHWYGGTIHETRENVIAGVRMCAKQMETLAVGQLYEYLNHGDIDEFMERFMKAPFVHAKKVTAEEAEKYMPQVAPMQVN
jgi:hypothetical protein